MTPAQHERARELFLAARELPPEARADFLRHSGEDEAIRAEVQSLLEHDTGSEFLNTPALGGRLAITEVEAFARERTAIESAASLGGSHPATIGPYRIVGVVGAGGMGIVYRAEQEQPRRTVALKVIRPGLTGSNTLRRFRQEAQVLGRLQHAGIAQIYEAGTATTEAAGGGLRVEQAYFAMEYVHGRPLLDYAEKQNLGTRSRLELLARICDAVQHAHQKGVIHRDLKPGNILVDETGQPKILDFGVARVTDSDVQVTTLHTDVGQLVGTLPYMSPEQVAGNPLDLDTRSDVYALGVLCYQLLANRPPLDLAGKTIPEAARLITEQEPTPLSSVNRVFRGDLDTVVSKALDKDKNQRYGSAADLAEDVRRFLADQPIAARPSTSWYQLRKFARRNRPLVIGVAVAFLALVAGMVATATTAVYALRARDRAQEAEQLAEKRLSETRKQTAIAEAVNNFLNDDLLGAADPYQEQDRNVTVRQVLDRAAKTIGERFQDQPAVEAAIRQTLGDAYKGLGEYAAACQQMERALELRRAVLGEEDAATLLTMNHLGFTYRRMGRLAEAEELLTRTFESRCKTLGPESSVTLSTMNHLALVHMDRGHYQQSEELMKQVMAIAQRRFGDEDSSYLTAMSNLADLYTRQERFAEAEPLHLRCLECERRLLGDEHIDTLSTMSSLGVLYVREGRLAEAEDVLTKTLERRRRVLGAEHPSTLATMTSLAIVYKQQGRYELAEALCRETLETKRRVLGPEHPNTLVSLNNLASLYAAAGRYAEAEPLYLQVLEARERVLGLKHPQTRGTLESLIELHTLWDRPEQAAEFQARLSAAQAATQPASQPPPRSSGQSALQPSSPPLPEPAAGADEVAETPPG